MRTSFRQKLARAVARARGSRLRTKLIAAAVLALLVLGGGAATFAALQSGGASRVGGSSPLDAYAQRIIDTCSKDTYPPRCYDKEIPKLMDQGLSLEDAFKVTGIIQNRVSNYFYCHVLGHELAAKETAKDPTKWTQVIARCPVGQCSNGCLHGAAQERFRNDVLTAQQQHDVIPQLEQICTDATRNFTGLEQASCFHSLGHLTMYMTGADITKSIHMCDIIAKQGQIDYTQTCYEGAYMQIFQPLEPEDFGLVRNIAPTTTAQAETFCDTFSGEPRNACHRESWPLYRASLQTPAGLTHFCGLADNPLDVTRCYNAAFYIITAQDNFQADRIIPLCKGLDDKRKAQCFANSASRFIETDYRLAQSAVSLCKVAEQDGVGDRCYGELLFYSTFNFHQGTPAFDAFCSDLPDPWKGRCYNGDGARMPLNQE